MFCSFRLFTYCCLVLPIICIALVLHLGHATGGVRVLIWMHWGLRPRLVATWAEFQHSVVYYATEWCRKRLKSCINAEGGHFEHLLWHCLPDIPVANLPHIATGSFQSHQRQPTTGSFQSLQRLKEPNKPTVRRKSFAIHKLVWWHFQVGLASGLQIVFLWDNVNNQKYIWIILLKMTFLDFPRYSGYIWQARWTICKIFM